MNSSIIIAIDGPSASGKSTISKLIAEALNYFYVDTGSMYRGLAWKALKDGIDPHQLQAVVSWLKSIEFECDFVESENGLFQLRNQLDGMNPGLAIRSSRVEEWVSIISAIPQVREFLVQKQRDLRRYGNLVVEGRDIGTIIFPETPFKFYLDADPEVRARRRAADQKALGETVPLQQVGQALAERDFKDSTRTVAPLKIAEDAIQIDTSSGNPQDNADLILKYIRSRHLMTQS